MFFFFRFIHFWIRSKKNDFVDENEYSESDTENPESLSQSVVSQQLSPNSPTCIICIINPIDTLLLPCSHARQSLILLR